MGLDELVNNTASSDSKNKKNKEDSDKIDKTVDDPGPDEVIVKQDDYPVKPIQCSECENSTAVWVSGIARDKHGDPTYGALVYCTRVFCDNSIFDVEDPPIEFDRLEMFKKMNERVESDESINIW